MDSEEPFRPTSGRYFRAEYWNGMTKVDEMTLPDFMATALANPWSEFPDDAEKAEERQVRLVTSWPVDYGRALNLETRLQKAFEQAPDAIFEAATSLRHVEGDA